MTEQDTPPPSNTFRRYLWTAVAGLSYWRAYWGRRLLGGAMGLMGDFIAEGAYQANYARFPGHPQQAPDSLYQVGQDRGLDRFRGETNANWVARVQAAWDDYEQGGTPQQMLHVVNQWGIAGFPTTWVALVAGNLVESTNPLLSTFTLTIPFGNISPAWAPDAYGGTHHYGDTGSYYGVKAGTDLAMLLYIVKKWKPSRSLCSLTLYTSMSTTITFTIG